MSTPIVKIPYLNPIRLFDRSGKLFENNIPFFEDQVQFYQKYNTSDYLTFQIQTLKTKNVSGIRTALVNLITGEEFISITYQIITDVNVGYNYWQCNQILSILPEGYYFLNLDIFFFDGETTTEINMISEPFDVKESHENTIKLVYTHEENDYDILFIPEQLSQIPFELRLEGGFASDGFMPASKDTIYQNQTYDTVILNSIPFVTEKLTFGGSLGIPNWLSEKIFRIFSCSNVKVDGVNYSKNEGAKMEATREKLYPMAGWQLELIKSINDYSDEINEENPFGGENILVGDGENLLVGNGVTYMDKRTYQLETLSDPTIDPYILTDKDNWLEARKLKLSELAEYIKLELIYPVPFTNDSLNADYQFIFYLPEGKTAIGAFWVDNEGFQRLTAGSVQIEGLKITINCNDIITGTHTLNVIYG